MNNDLVSRLLDGLVAPEGAFNDDPPIWAQDPFNGDTAEKCGRCHAWRSVVRPGKTQCDYCCDNNNYSLHIEAATALTEARAEIERLRNLLGDPDGTIAHADAITGRAETAESELSTLRAQSLVKDHAIIEAAKLAKRLMTRAVAAEKLFAEAHDILSRVDYIEDAPEFTSEVRQFVKDNQP